MMLRVPAIVRTLRMAVLVIFDHAILRGTGDWVGVELDKPSGSHDGGAHGSRYFTCMLFRTLLVHATCLRE